MADLAAAIAAVKAKGGDGAAPVDNSAAAAVAGAPAADGDVEMDGNAPANANGLALNGGTPSFGHGNAHAAT